MSSSENALPTPPTPHGPLLAPSHHRTSSTLQRHLETALAPATLNKRSASVTDQIELEEWWSLTPERLRRIFKEVDVDNDGRLPFACLVDLASRLWSLDWRGMRVRERCPVCMLVRTNQKAPAGRPAQRLAAQRLR